MLDLKKDIVKKFFVTIVFLFIAVFTVAYFLLKQMLLSNLDPAHDNIFKFLDIYNTIWAEIILVTIFFGFIAFLYIKKVSDALLEDVENFSDYIEEINKKNYDAVVKIQHYKEFLKMSLVFKNIVKRLGQKKKKQ